MLSIQTNKCLQRPAPRGGFSRLFGCPEPKGGAARAPSRRGRPLAQGNGRGRRGFVKPKRAPSEKDTKERKKERKKERRKERTRGRESESESESKRRGHRSLSFRHRGVTKSPSAWSSRKVLHATKGNPSWAKSLTPEPSSRTRCDRLITVVENHQY